MNIGSVRTLIAAVSVLTGVIPAMAQPINPVVKPYWQSLLESLPGILWVGLAIGAVLYFSNELKDLLRSVVQRLKAGSAVKFGPVELGELPSIPAAIPQGAKVSQYWDTEKLRKDDGSLRARWDRYPADSNYAMLVHRYLPSSEPEQVYDVLLYFVERKKGALQRVSKVEYYFGPNWNDLIYPSEDRAKSFAIRVSAYDRFICIAKLHFTTNETAIVARYIDFEMGILPTIPATPPKAVSTLVAGG